MEWAAPHLARAPQVVILAELLESLAAPHAVLSRLVAALPPETLFVVTYTNADSLPARMMRRYWSQLFDHKAAFLSTGNLTALAARSGLVLKTQYPLPGDAHGPLRGGHRLPHPGPARRSRGR